MSVHSSRAFDHVVILMFENEYRSYVRDNAYMRALAAQGLDLSTYFGVMHPSNPNYVASIAGEICNTTQDPCYYTFLPLPEGVPGLPPPPAPLQQRTIANLLVEKGLGWKAYMEAYQPVEFPPQLAPVTNPATTEPIVAATVKHTICDYPPYLNSHNAFVRFESIMQNREQWTRIDGIYPFLRDALDGTLPEYSWVTPNIWSNGHWLTGTYVEPEDRGRLLVDQLARWLQNFFAVLRFPGPNSRLPPRTLVVVTFDESDYDGPSSTSYEGPNQIYTVLLGDMIRPGRVDDQGYNHYSLLRTVERNFALGDLGKNDTEANWFRFLWGERFRWDASDETPITAADVIAATGLGDTLVVIDGGADGARLRTYDGAWSESSGVPVSAGTTAVELAARGDELVLVCRNADGLSALTYQECSGWSAPQSLAAGVSGAFALVGYRDHGDGTEKVMLAWQSASGGIESAIYADGVWAPPVAVGQQTDGDIVLAVLGASLYLIHKAVGGDGMSVVSYNTAPCNVVTGTSHGDNDTTINAWSPSEFPVAHFGHRPGVVAPQPYLQPYSAAAPFAAATLDGVVHLVHAGPDDPRLLEERFSLSGVLTPLKAFSPTKSNGASMGYGTLAEAGWTKQTPIADAQNVGGAMAMARFGGKVALLYQPEATGAVRMSIGGYHRHG